MMRAFAVQRARASLVGAARAALTALTLGAAAASSMASTACSPGAAMSADEVKHHGVLLLRTTGEKAFKASIEALKSLGYEIAIEAPEKGMIVTKRKGMADLTIALNTPITKQYTVVVFDAGGAVRITATPALFENDVDVSSRKLWDLDGPVGERELWRQLFAKIEQLL